MLVQLESKFGQLLNMCDLMEDNTPQHFVRLHPKYAVAENIHTQAIEN